MQGEEVILVFRIKQLYSLFIVALCQLGRVVGLEAQPQVKERLNLLLGVGACARLLELGNGPIMIAGSRQDDAQLEMQLCIFAMKLDAPTKRLDLILVEHLVQLV